jgi:PAS domain S-box-containing protein
MLLTLSIVGLAAGPEPIPPPRPVLTAAQQVRELTAAAAARKLPVRLTGVVTHANPHIGDFFVQDDSAGIYVVESRLPLPAPGDRAEVVGVTDPGGFAPCVIPTAVRVVGRGPLPDPLPFDLTAEGSRWLDGQLVSVAAVVRSAGVGPKSGYTDLQIETGAGAGIALIPGHAALDQVRGLVGKPVWLTGVCVPWFDGQRAVSGPPRLLVQSADRIKVYTPPRGDRPVDPVPVADLLRRYSPDPHPAIRLGAVNGVVVGRFGQTVFVQDDTGGLAVHLAVGGSGGCRVGDRVVVRGELHITGKRTALTRATVTVVGPGVEPVPQPWTSRQLAAGEPGGQVGRFTGRVEQVTANPGQPATALVRDPDGLFEVVLAAGDRADRLPAGATVSAVGVPAQVPGAGAVGNGWAVVARTAADVQVLADPPPAPARSWWTSSQVAAVVGGSAVAALAALAWAVLLRRIVRRQTALIHRQLLVEKQLEAGYRDLFDHAGDAVWVTDAAGRLTDLNNAAEKLFGLPKARAVGRPVSDFLSPSQAGLVRDSVVARADAPFELTVRPASGPAVVVEAASRVLPGGGVQTTGRDLTERKKLQDRVQRVQKLEAVGRLAGGLAHDFNNLLTVINGNAELAAGLLPADSPARDLIAEVQAAGVRAAGLTRQLLSFSRQRFVALTRVDLNRVLADITPLLQRMAGPKVKLVVDPAADLPRVSADVGMVEQVLMNLVVNARDATPAGGTITVTTARLPAGGARLTVADTGVGMDEATQARVFEPFFTTKEVGQGTGLGLATVYGIVQTLNGAVRFTSAVGVGTTFEIDLPPATEPVGRHDTPPVTEPSAGVVLLVEDEPSVRAFAAGVMEAAGLTVLQAEDGDSALRLLADTPGPVDVLLTDVVMPGMTGREVAAAVKKVRPGVRVVYMSGYPGDAGPTAADGGVYVSKPFNPAELLAKVKSVMR